MSTSRYQPKRRLLNELYSLVAVFWIPAAVVAVFPFDAFRFKSRQEQPRQAPICSFVSLSAAESSAALVAARSALKTADAGVAGYYADLSVDALPETPLGGIVDMPPADIAGGISFEYSGVPLPPSMMAGKPAVIPKDEPEAQPAFSREAMLDAKTIPENKPE